MTDQQKQGLLDLLQANSRTQERHGYGVIQRFSVIPELVLSFVEEEENRVVAIHVPCDELPKYLKDQYGLTDGEADVVYSYVKEAYSSLFDDSFETLTEVISEAMHRGVQAALEANCEESSDVENVKGTPRVERSENADLKSKRRVAELEAIRDRLRAP